MLQTMRFNRILAILAFALSAALSAQNLTSVKVDSMSDDEIRAVLKAGADKGLDINEGEKLALSMGLPQEEAAKFKARVDQLNGKNKPAGQAPNAPAAGDGTVSSTSTLGNTTAVETEVLQQAEVKSEAAVAVAGLSEGTDGPGEKIPVQVYGQQYFRGGDIKIYERSIDDNGRLALPAPFRGDLGDRCYATLDPQGCITVRTVATFET
jgi:hypothetical protein